MLRNVPIIKKGAKGIWLFNPFFSRIINPNPIIAPKRKAKNIPHKMLGKPKRSPKSRANLTSPKPIQRPLEIKNIDRKNPEAIIAAKI